MEKFSGIGVQLQSQRRENVLGLGLSEDGVVTSVAVNRARPDSRDLSGVGEI